MSSSILTILVKATSYVLTACAFHRSPNAHNWSVYCTAPISRARRACSLYGIQIMYCWRVPRCIHPSSTLRRSHRYLVDRAVT